MRNATSTPTLSALVRARSRLPATAFKSSDCGCDQCAACCSGVGRVSGYLVRYGDPSSADAQNDFFTRATDFGLDFADRYRVVYHHGLGRVDALATKLGNRKIGTATVVAHPGGLFLTAVLDSDDPDVCEVYRRVQRGELGFSSGSVDRLVRRTAVGGKRRIDAWPLVEVSLSPRPVDARNRASVVSVKARVAEILDRRACGDGFVAGRVVVFGGEDMKADQIGDVFDASCDFGFKGRRELTLPIRFNHGFPFPGGAPNPFGARAIGEVVVSKRDDGLYAVGRLDVDDPQVRQVHARLRRGELGWSAGASRGVSKWPIGERKRLILEFPLREVSLTPSPLEPRLRGAAKAVDAAYADRVALFVRVAEIRNRSRLDVRR